jgi:CHAT domain-containing protein
MVLAGLALAGANRRGEEGEDGILTALEASHLHLDGCDLVVLSACETALGTALPGEGVLGLVQGFRTAGARGVVASLWKVDDDATRLLMDRFHTARLVADPPLSPPEALRRAARALREDPRYSAPRHWAAFVAYESR